jgi:ABC-type glycerol-3-phosphate transport system substrate-binding protein
VLVYGTSIVIFTAAPKEKKDIAWEFVRWFTGREQTARWSIATNYMPVRKSALTTREMEKHFTADPDSRISIKELDYSFFEPRDPLWNECRQYLADAVKEALLGERSAEEALDRAAVRCNRLFR